MQMLATTEQAFTESELALWFHSSCGEIFADGVLFGVNMKAGARCSSGAGFLLAALARLAGPFLCDSEHQRRRRVGLLRTRRIAAVAHFFIQPSETAQRRCVGVHSGDQFAGRVSCLKRHAALRIDLPQ